MAPKSKPKVKIEDVRIGVKVAEEVAVTAEGIPEKTKPKRALKGEEVTDYEKLQVMKAKTMYEAWPARTYPQKRFQV